MTDSLANLGIFFAGLGLFFIGVGVLQWTSAATKAMKK